MAQASVQLCPDVLVEPAVPVRHDKPALCHLLLPQIHRQRTYCSRNRDHTIASAEPASPCSPYTSSGRNTLRSSSAAASPASLSTWQSNPHSVGVSVAGVEPVGRRHGAATRSGPDFATEQSQNPVDVLRRRPIESPADRVQRPRRCSVGTGQQRRHLLTGHAILRRRVRHDVARTTSATSRISSAGTCASPAAGTSNCEMNDAIRICARHGGGAWRPRRTHAGVR